MENASASGEGTSRAVVPVVVLAAAGALLTLAYAGTLAWLAGRWWTDPFYSHGPLVPLVSLYLLWRGRRELRCAPAAPAGGVLLLSASGALHLLGVRLMFEFLSSVSLIGALAGIAWLAGGRPLLRRAAFPLAYLLFAIPLPQLILEQVSLPLQMASSAAASALLRGLGCAVIREGVQLRFPEFTLAVADACSGLHSLISVLALSTLAAFLSPAPLHRRVFLVLLSSIAALAANVVRIATTAFVGLMFGGPAATLFFERASGLLFFALVILAVLAIATLLARPKTTPAPSEAPPAVPSRPGSLLKILIPLAAILLPTALAAAVLKAHRAKETPSHLTGWRPAIEGWTLGELGRPAVPPGEEAVQGTLERPGGPRVAFSVLHSVSGRYLHSPEACSAARGWIPERQERREGSGGLPANLWVMRKGDERVCLVFWYALGGRPAAGSFDHHLRAVGQRLREGWIDSAYGEISLSLATAAEPIPEDRLLELAGALHRQIAERLWPTAP